MARRVIISDGKDPLTKPILDYLTREYGLNIVDDVRRVQLDSCTGEAQIITVELLVRATEKRDGMADLYDCCDAAPTQPHRQDCSLHTE